MFAIGKFYQTTQNHNLMASDKAGVSTKDGGSVMGIVNMGDLVMVTGRGRYRFVQVIYKDMVGYIWLPTNLATNQVFIDASDQEKQSEIFQTIKKPFVKPTRAARPK